MADHKIQPQDVHYLSFEGGGGKGIAFVGALRALEQLGVLSVKPIKKDVLEVASGEDMSLSHIVDNENLEENLKIKVIKEISGISGSSAGAITALFVAMGVTSTEVLKIIKEGLIIYKKKDGLTYKKKTVKLADFFEGPDSKKRSVKNNKPKQESHGADATTIITALLGTLGTLSFFVKVKDQFLKLIKRILVDLGAVFVLVGLFIKYKYYKTDSPLMKKVLANPVSCLSNFFIASGIFSGMKCREFFTLSIQKYLNENFGEKFTEKDIITFSEFKRVTNIDLVIVGTNISRNKAMFFDAKRTPDFPVAEAVCISMNIPILFKPIKIEGASDPEYDGLWVDGGVVNNCPIHAFDDRVPAIKGCPDPELRPLNNNTLGLRLVSQDDRYNLASVKKKAQLKLDAKNNKGDNPFAGNDGFIGNLVGSVLYHTEEGQIGSLYERDHTIEIATMNLKLTEFSPPDDDANMAMQGAYDDVYKYFGKKKLNNAEFYNPMA